VAVGADVRVGGPAVRWALVPGETVVVGLGVSVAGAGRSAAGEDGWETVGEADKVAGGEAAAGTVGGEDKTPGGAAPEGV
jgi:hypothetical protein